MQAATSRGGMLPLAGRTRLLLAALLLGRVPVAEASFDVPELLRRHFRDVCAHPPEPQRAAAPGPLDEKTLEEHGLEFVALNVVFRHGARSVMHSPYDCFPKQFADSIISDCGVHTGNMLDWLANETAKRKEVAGTPPLVKKYHGDYGTYGEASASSCGPAQLLDEAVDQFEALGGALRGAYFGRLPEEPSLDSTWLYSTDTDRTIASTYLLQHFLFSGSKAGSRPLRTAELQTRSQDSDAWARRVPCPAAEKAVEEASEQAGTPDDFLGPLKKRWLAKFGKPFSQDCHDPVLVANCSGKLPADALSGEDSLLAEVVVANFLHAKAKYLDAKEAWTSLVGPALLELQDLARRQAEGKERKALALWATHDTVILPMLVSLGVWDGVWPQYTEAILLEVYREKANGGKAWVRLLRRGEPLEVPSCHPLGPGGLCDLEHLLPKEVARLRDLPVREQLCTGGGDGVASPSSVAMGVAEVPSKDSMSLMPSVGRLAGLLMTIVTAFGGGAVVGRRFGRDDRRRADDSAFAPLLQH